MKENFDFETEKEPVEGPLDPMAAPSGEIDPERVAEKREEMAEKEAALSTPTAKDGLGQAGAAGSTLETPLGSVSGHLSTGESPASGRRSSVSAADVSELDNDTRPRGQSVVGSDLHETQREQRGDMSDESSLRSSQIVSGENDEREDDPAKQQAEVALKAAASNEEPHTTMRPLSSVSGESDQSLSGPSFESGPEVVEQTGDVVRTSVGISPHSQVPTSGSTDGAAAVAAAAAVDATESGTGQSGVPVVPSTRPKRSPASSGEDAESASRSNDAESQAVSGQQTEQSIPVVPSTRPKRSPAPAAEQLEATSETGKSAETAEVAEPAASAVPSVPSSRPKRSPVPEPAEERVEPASEQPVVAETTGKEETPAQLPEIPSSRPKRSSAASTPEPSATDSEQNKSLPVVPSSRPKRSPAPAPAPETAKAEASKPSDQSLDERLAEPATRLPATPVVPATRPKRSTPAPDESVQKDAQREQPGAAADSPAKPKPPARPPKKFGSTFNPIDAEANAAKPSRPKPAVGSKIAALRGSLFNDLNNMIARGPQGGPPPRKPSDEPAEEDMPPQDNMSEAVAFGTEAALAGSKSRDADAATTGDVRRTRAKGPRGKRLPTAAQTSLTVSIGAIWEIPRAIPEPVPAPESVPEQAPESVQEPVVTEAPVSESISDAPPIGAPKENLIVATPESVSEPTAEPVATELNKEALLSETVPVSNEPDITNPVNQPTTEQQPAKSDPLAVVTPQEIEETSEPTTTVETAPAAPAPAAVETDPVAERSPSETPVFVNPLTPSGIPEPIDPAEQPAAQTTRDSTLPAARDSRASLTRQSVVEPADATVTRTSTAASGNSDLKAAAAEVLDSPSPVPKTPQIPGDEDIYDAYMSPDAPAS